jgi:hypothetical protein
MRLLESQADAAKIQAQRLSHIAAISGSDKAKWEEEAAEWFQTANQQG